MHLTLLQLNSLVKESLESSLPGTFWVEAELSECRESGGHCYMDLIQKDENSRTPVARASARCWRSTWSLLRPRFERVTGQALHPGMKVLLKVKANFHEAFGFAWVVFDIDPTYTIGDMARKRQEIIDTLKREGVFDLNKSLTVPRFAQRIAVVSSATAAGYGDFCNQLLNNEYGFQFHTQLFPAIMQGEMVEESVIAALNRIYDSIDDYDIVVIIRGGGGTSDLSGFDTLMLAENVANFPLPVITGIGHERDETVLDMISCVRVKTPTAAAAFLISNLARTLETIDSLAMRITELVRRRMDMEHQRITRVESFLPLAFTLRKNREEARMEQLMARLTMHISQRLTKEKYLLESLSARVEALDPKLILKRGYAIVTSNGRTIKSPTDVSAGDVVNIILSEGEMSARIQP